MLDDAQLEGFARVVADLAIAGIESGVKLRAVCVGADFYAACLASAHAESLQVPKLFLSNLGIWIYRFNVPYLRDGLVYPLYQHSLNWENWWALAATNGSGGKLSRRCAQRGEPIAPQ